MAEEKQNKNFIIIVGACAVISIALVLALKSDETKHLELKGSNTTLESNAKALHDAKRFENNFYE